MIDLLNSSLKDITTAIRNKKLSIKELCQFYLDRIEKYNPQFNAVVCLNDSLIKQASHMDRHFNQYKDLPLVGIPILFKDIFCTKGIRTTAASRILANFIPPYSAEVVCRLEQAGALILGKCNQDEFAMGNSNENSVYGPVPNPWNRQCVSGGSSGGSAVAVALGLSPVAIGTDTGGSIRQPAAFCNIVGVKPTYGRVSRYGMIAYASSLDQAGPMTMNVEDSACMLQIMAGKDEKDSTSLDQPVPSWTNLKTDISSIKVGYLPPENDSDHVSAEVLQVLQEVLKVLKKYSAEVKTVTLPCLELAVPTYYLISTSEASSNLARYDGVRYGYRMNSSSAKKATLARFYQLTRSQGLGAEVKRRILMGTFCLSHGYYEEYYNKACQIRRHIRDAFSRLFSDLSLLLTPVSATPAWRLGQTRSGSLPSYLNDRFTVASNLAGLPALSIPAGFSSDGLPIGVQLIASHFNEHILLNTASLIERELKAGGRRPNVG